MSFGDERRRPPRPAAHELERYSALFATRTGRMRSSVMRDLMAVTDRLDIISLAGGLPDTSLFEPRLFTAAMERIADGATAAALQYGPTDGLQPVKECIVQIMAEEDTRVAADELIVTTGGQQAIDLVCKTLLDPGDVVIAEGPTYPGAVPTFCAYEAQVVQIEMDADGMQIDLLERTLDQLAAEGRRPKFIYTIPTFQNPAGVSMSLARRRRLVEVARERELLVLEDNPYGLLRYEGDALPTLRSLEVPRGSRDGGEFVIYVGTMSKILSAGIRIGWVVAPRPVLAKLNLGKVSSDLCSSSLTQHFVAAYFANGDWREYVNAARETYHVRRDAMLDALAESCRRRRAGRIPTAACSSGSRCPTTSTRPTCSRARCASTSPSSPERGPTTTGRGHNAMRLNFSSVPEEQIREGIRRIAKIVDEQLALYGSLTGRHGAAPADDAANELTEELAPVLELPRRSGEGARRSRPA